MLNLRYPKYNVSRKATIATALALVAMLTACGGGNSDNPSSTSNTALTPSGSPDTSAADTAAANPSFFDGIFLDGTGAGYYQFAANYADAFYPTATGQVRIYVTADANTNFSTTPTAILGPYVASNQGLYLTAEGLFISSGPESSGLGGARIFQQLPQGYQWGPNGISAPLYEITLTAEDVAGQRVSYVAGRDEAGGNGLTVLLGSDTTPMPAGAQTYRQTAKVLVSHVSFNTASRVKVFTTLEQTQAYYGGTVQTLGGYRYLLTSNQQAYAEYNGAVYFAAVHNVGDVDDAMPSGYNKIAADFLVQEELKTGLPH
jgi:hypothetical protein